MLAVQGRAIREEGSRNCTAGFYLHYTDALQKFRNRVSSGNPVIYNCSNPSLCGRKFLFLLPQYSYTSCPGVWFFFQRHTTTHILSGFAPVRHLPGRFFSGF